MHLVLFCHLSFFSLAVISVSHLFFYLSFLISSLSYIIVSLFMSRFLVSFVFSGSPVSSKYCLVYQVSPWQFSALQLSHRYFSHPLMLSFSPSSVLFSSLSFPLMKVSIFSFSVSWSSVLSFMISFLSNISWTVSSTSVSTFGSVQSSF